VPVLSVDFGLVVEAGAADGLHGVTSAAQHSPAVRRVDTSVRQDGGLNASSRDH
jgi:hypothetical protein